jgi:hypothetical protein
MMVEIFSRPNLAGLLIVSQFTDELGNEAVENLSTL